MVLGAAVGLLSTKLSDHRKLAADDRRQWDKEIRDLYLEAVESCSEVDEYRGEQDPEKLKISIHMAALHDAATLDTIASSLELIANEATVAAARNLAQTVHQIANHMHDGINKKELYKDMYDAQQSLLHAVKVNLRTAKATGAGPK